MPIIIGKKEEPKFEQKSTLKIPKLNSLKEEVNTPKNVTEEEALDLNIRNPFTDDQLKTSWNEFAQKLKSAKRDIEYNVIANRELIVDTKFMIHIKLDNMIQQDQFNVFKADLADHLRKNLKNNLILIDATVTKEESKKIIYTSEDKFKYLSEKYPIIADLKKRLDLETDF